MKTVFLSSTARDLTEYRDRVYAVIEGLTGYHCVRMEDITSQARDPLGYLRDLVSNCDLFISLVGLCYGSCPPNSRVSFTEHEYEFAEQVDMPRLVFVLPENYSLPADILMSDGRWEDQKSFRARVGRDLIRATFDTPDQLAAQVVSAIRNFEMGIDGQQRGGEPEKVDCVVLCGGYARRLWPLTVDLSKVTLPVANKPVLTYVLEFLRKSGLVKDIVLSVNKKYADQISSFLSIHDKADSTVHLIAEPESGPEGKLGPVGAIDYVVSQTSPRDLLVVGGDNLLGFKLKDFLSFAANWERSANAVFRFPAQEDTSEYGVASLNSDGIFVDFVEKKALASFRDVSTACYLFRHADVQAVRRYLSDGHDPDSLGSFLHWLVTQGRPPVGYQFSSFWFDVGTREKLLAANQHFISDRRRGNAISTSFKAPVLVHETATITDSLIGPNVSVGKEAHISGSEVSNCIILERAEIRNSQLSDSVVGPNSVVQGHVTDLVCGPRSRIHHEPHEL